MRQLEFCLTGYPKVGAGSATVQRRNLLLFPDAAAQRKWLHSRIVDRSETAPLPLYLESCSCARPGGWRVVQRAAEIRKPKGVTKVY